MAKYKYDQSFSFQGQRVRIRANTKKELMDKIERKRKSLEGSVTDENTTVKTWAQKWIETYKRDSVSSNWYADLTLYLKKLEPIAHVPVSQIKPAQLQGILNKESGKAFSTVKKAYDVFRSLFKQAYIEGLISKDITVGIIMPSYKEATPRRAITPQERAAILSVIKKHEKGHFFAIMLFSGLRPSEVRALRWKDIDQAVGQIHVSKALDDKRNVKVTKSKSGNRIVPYYSELSNYLSAGNPDDYVVSNQNGMPLSEQNYKKMWKSFKRLLHVEFGGKLYRNEIILPYKVASDLTPYCLRHTFCTDLEKSGVPINIASKIMGHSSISITSKIYTHYDEETIALASEILNGQSTDKVL